ncbi:riboflavin synthase subunit alpha [[Limnothrix rosea] IAM M-220]|uniref:riboflavin synthase subunit alpha n=1 Tax=[Limnothrix rosea] IAM M-220 TaxID=454133 RepID=UPI000960C8E0|nr:riboflavin synthase subunit alpha [[Limnothrix rosea] IAM M-220]OKH18013.1 riboflavin synthase subunit alpha [[Limnothrix rosea] IAM M-220]
MNLSLFALGIAVCAICLSFNTKEEVVKVATASVAVFTGFLAVCYAPWMIKLVVIVVPLLLDRINHWSADT